MGGNQAFLLLFFGSIFNCVADEFHHFG